MLYIYWCFFVFGYLDKYCKAGTKYAALFLVIAITLALLASVISVVAELWLTGQDKTVQVNEIFKEEEQAILTFNVQNVDKHVTYGAIMQGKMEISSLPQEALNADGTTKYDVIIESNSFVNPKKIIPAGSSGALASKFTIKAKERTFGKYTSSMISNVWFKVKLAKSEGIEVLPVSTSLIYHPSNLELIAHSRVNDSLFDDGFFLNMQVPFIVILSLMMCVAAAWLLGAYNIAICYVFASEKAYGVAHYLYGLISPVMIYVLSLLPSYNPYNKYIFDSVTSYFCYGTSVMALGTLFVCHVHRVLFSNYVEPVKVDALRRRRVR